MSFAQNNLKTQYENFNTLPKSLNICGQSEKISVTVSTEGSSVEARTNIETTLNLFKGVRFVELITSESTSGVTVLNATNPNKPILSLPNLSPSGLNSVKIVFKISADCDFLDALNTNNAIQVYDAWTLKYNLGASSTVTETDNLAEYRDAFTMPFFSIIVKDNNYSPQKAGNTLTRTLIVNNSGLNGYATQIKYSNLQGKDIVVKKIRVNGVEIPFTKASQSNGDTLITATISGTYFQGNTKGNGNAAGNGDTVFDSDETLTITEDVYVLKCDVNTESKHSISWGCYGKECTVVNTNDFIPIGQGAPNVSISQEGSIAPTTIGYCQQGVAVLVFKNTGVEVDNGFGTMYNIAAGIGLGANFTTAIKGYKIKAITLAGKEVPLNNSALVDLSVALDFKTDPDGVGGLEDIDDDGSFDDLKVGKSFEVIIKYDFDCSVARDTSKDCKNDLNASLSGIIYYNNACGERLNNLKESFVSATNSNNYFENSSDPDAYIGQGAFQIRHKEERSVFGFDKACQGGDRLFVKVALPKGITPDYSNTFLYKNDGTIPVLLKEKEIKKDTLYLYFDADSFLNGKYNLKLSLQASCDAQEGDSNFPFQFGFICPECNCTHIWYCGKIKGPSLHPTAACNTQLCPVGLRTTGFSAKRTTLGYTDATFTTKISPSKANLKEAISCDSIQMTIKNVVGQTPLTDSIGMVIKYIHIDSLKSQKEIFKFGNGKLYIKNGATLLKTCDITAAAAHVTTLPDQITKIVKIDLNNCLKNNNITLNPNDSVIFQGNFHLEPDGPYKDKFRVTPLLRAWGYGVVNGVEYNCGNFGDALTIAKNQTTFDLLGTNQIEGCTAKTYDYALVRINNGFGKDYFKGEFRQAVKVDEITINFDKNLLTAFDKLDIEYSVPGNPVYGSAFLPLGSLKEATNGIYYKKFDANIISSLNSSGTFAFNFRINTLPNCKTIAGSNNADNTYAVQPTLKLHDRYYAAQFGTGACAKDTAVTISSKSWTYAEPPTLSIAPLSNPNYTMTNNSAEWTLKVCNESIVSDAGVNWLALETSNPSVKIISIQDISSGTPITLTSNNYGTSSTNTFAMSKSLKHVSDENTASDICTTFKVKASVSNCSSAELIAKTGWNCAAYPSSWNPSLNAPCTDVAQTLRIISNEANIDAEINEQFLENPALCDTLTLELLVRNTGQAPLFNVKTQLTLPLQGATLIPGSVTVAYPSKSAFKPAKADPTPIGATLKGATLEYTNFSSLSEVLNTYGVAAFNPLNPSDSNEYRIRYKVVTDCNFRSGVVSYFSVQGKNSCGVATNLDAGESVPISILGTSIDPNVKSFTLILNKNALIVPNGPSSLELEATNLKNTPTDEKDRISIKLPIGFSYINASSVGVVPNTWKVAEPEIKTESGFQILSWQMPIGLTQNEKAIVRFKVSNPDFNCAINPNFQGVLSTLRRTQIQCSAQNKSCEIDAISTLGGEINTQLPTGCCNIVINALDTITIKRESATVIANTISGGKAPYSYKWTPNSNINSNNIQEPTVNPLEDKQYTLLVTDAANCTANKNVFIRVQQLDTLPVTITEPVRGLGYICPKDTLKIKVGGGTTYEWTALPNNPAGGYFSDYHSPSPFFTSSLEGAIYKYQVRVTDPQFPNIEGKLILSIEVLAKPKITVIPSPSTDICAGVEVNLHAEGQYGDEYIEWVNVPNEELLSEKNDLIVKPNETTTYRVYVTDTLSTCSNFKDISINIIPNLNVKADTIQTICKGATTTLGATVSGGTGNYSYSWFPTIGLDNANKLNPLASPTKDTVYTLTVKDISSGCQASSAVHINVNQDPSCNCKPVVLDSINIIKATCGNDNGAIYINISANTTQDYNYTWTPDIGQIAGNGKAKTKLIAGKYSIIIRDKNNVNCSTTIDTVVNASCLKPIAVNDTLATRIGETIPIDILKNDTINGTLVKISEIEPPILGKANISSENLNFYTADFEVCPRVDSFQYIICNEDACDTATVYIKVRCKGITVYNGVTPNNDGINDILYIDNIDEFPNNNIYIYNRWGNLIYNTQSYDNDTNNWKGKTLSSKDVPDGTYFYILELNDDKQQVLKGYIQIQR